MYLVHSVSVPLTCCFVVMLVLVVRYSIECRNCVSGAQGIPGHASPMKQEYTTFKLHIVPNQSVLNEALVIQELPVGNGALDAGYEYVTAAEG